MNKQTLTEESQPIPSPHLQPQPKLLALYSLRPRSPGPWEGQSTGLSDLAEMEKADWLPGLAEAVSLQPFPSFLGLGRLPSP